MLLIKEQIRLWPVIRYVSLNLIHTNITLALLFRIIEGVGVEEGPNKLAADIFEAKFKVSVLVDGVMAALEGGGADVDALLVSDFFGADEPVGVTSSGGCDGRIVRMCEEVAQGYASLNRSN